MKTVFCLVMTLLPGLFCNAAHAYGSQGGQKACTKPSFTKFQPSPDEAVLVFDGFAFSASPNTAATSLKVTVRSEGGTQVLDAKALQITENAGGGLEVKGRLEKPVGAGFARLDITAKSKSGCDKAEGYLVKIKP